MEKTQKKNGKKCKCPYCDIPLPKTSPLCKGCGSDLRFCSECGKVIQRDLEECPECGAKSPLKTEE
ncbi:hypothetical protein GF312_17475 [Candidatus Poribacteria bacterium]|nr:hypothetical protein [Candidatus Poribacteria bacterium]